MRRRFDGGNDCCTSHASPVAQSWSPHRVSSAEKSHRGPERVLTRANPPLPFSGWPQASSARDCTLFAFGLQKRPDLGQRRDQWNRRGGGNSARHPQGREARTEIRRPVEVPLLVPIHQKVSIARASLTSSRKHSSMVIQISLYSAMRREVRTPTLFDGYSTDVIGFETIQKS